MALKSPGRIVRAVADAMWERDQLQMRAMDKLLSAVAAPRQRRFRARSKRRPKRQA